MLLLSSSSSGSYRGTGSISPRSSSALSASASESTTETAVSLGDLIDRHIAARLATANAVRAWEQCKAGEITSIAYPNRLLDVARDEEAARLAIVNYRPRDFAGIKTEADLFSGIPDCDTGDPERQRNEFRLGSSSRLAIGIGFLRPARFRRFLDRREPLRSGGAFRFWPQRRE